MLNTCGGLLITSPAPSSLHSISVIIIIITEFRVVVVGPNERSCVVVLFRCTSMVYTHIDNSIVSIMLLIAIYRTSIAAAIYRFSFWRIHKTNTDTRPRAILYIIIHVIRRVITHNIMLSGSTTIVYAHRLCLPIAMVYLTF